MRPAPSTALRAPDLLCILSLLTFLFPSPPPHRHIHTFPHSPLRHIAPSAPCLPATPRLRVRCTALLRHTHPRRFRSVWCHH